MRIERTTSEGMSDSIVERGETTMKKQYPIFGGLTLLVLAAIAFGWSGRLGAIVRAAAVLGAHLPRPRAEEVAGRSEREPRGRPGDARQACSRSAVEGPEQCREHRPTSARIEAASVAGPQTDCQRATPPS